MKELPYRLKWFYRNWVSRTSPEIPELWSGLWMNEYDPSQHQGQSESRRQLGIISYEG